MNPALATPDRRTPAQIGRYAVVLAIFMLLPAAVIAAEASASGGSSRVQTVLSSSTSRVLADSITATWLGLLVAERVSSGLATEVTRTATCTHANTRAVPVGRAVRANLIDLPPPSC